MNTVETDQPRFAIPDDATPLVESRELEAIRKIETCVAYMMCHLEMPLQAATLAAQVNISPSHFFTLFKRHVGRTPMDYFIRLRLRRACHLLENTEMSIKAIAYTLGYNDPYYFSRIFKSFNRMAPSQYRLLKLRSKETPKDYRPARFPASGLPPVNLRRDHSCQAADEAPGQRPPEIHDLHRGNTILVGKR
jgi:AraC-like DNA-binding protein